MLSCTHARQETAARPPARAIFLRRRGDEGPWATCFTRMKNDSATALRAAPAPSEDGGRLEHRRHGSRVDKAGAADPARRASGASTGVSK